MTPNQPPVEKKQMSEWKTMESAPKDGTPVLLHWGKGYHPLSGHYENGAFGFLGFDWGFSPFPSQPKFWLPMDAIPTPPEG